MRRAPALFAILLTITAAAHAYTTATIVGKTTHDGKPLSGVGVKISSPAMQESRSTTTDLNGRYAFLAIPPGEYSVTFVVDGMQTASTKVRAGVGQTARADAALREGSSEAPIAAETVSAVIETTAVQSNARTSTVDLLPTGRDPDSVVNLAPGTRGRSISGGGNRTSFWLFDGAASIDPFGNPLNVYVEDAIQETTLLSASIPAEYGRFNGGVVNTVTLSGGNELSGSFRDSFSNPSWTAPSPYQHIQNADQLEQTFEATVGGAIVRDGLWFFAAGRKFTDSIQQLYAQSPSWGYTTTSDDLRWQAKLTGEIAGHHALVGSYASRPLSQDNFCFVSCVEPSNLDPNREVPQSLASVHYSGTLTPRVVAEAFWGDTDVRFKGSGGDSTDQVLGTWGHDVRTGSFFGAPVFCGTCDSETRESTNVGLKGTYYLALPSLGTHTISAGYDHWAADVVANNYQSGSEFQVFTFSPQTYSLTPGEVFRPRITPGDIIQWSPIPIPDKSSNQHSHGAFVNDRWDLGMHWSFNIGLRYDLNDIVDESGLTVSDSGTLEPRLSAVWDVRGDGRYRVNGSYGEYSDLIDAGTGSATWSGGVPLALYWEYDGPRIEGLPTFEAFRIVFDWFNARCDSEGNCGAENTDGMLRADNGWVGGTFGGIIDSSLVKEASLGFSFAAGSSAYVRLDGIRRDWSRFLVRRVTIETGQTVDPFGKTVDVAIIENNDRGLERSYEALMVQAAYALGTRWNFGGNCTWSVTESNAVSNHRVVVGPDWYPELTAFPRFNPVFEDRQWKVRAWAVYHWPTNLGTFDVSVLESFDSGTPYSVVGGISTAFDPVARSAYANAPRVADYFFSERGAYSWDDVTSTDVGLRYQFPLFHTGIFVDLAVANVFNESAQTGGDTYVSTRWDPSCRQTADPTKPCALFNPFTDTPVEGVHYVKSVTFAQAISPSHYQTPRTYSFSVGARF